MFYQLPPVGNPVCLDESSADNSLPAGVFGPYRPRFFASGTAALAVAIQAAIRLHDVATPEVILPAYGCPDLVSAVIYAGGRPVLVDLEPERPWMDAAQVSAAITAQTAALVAVDLFGIPERMELLRQLVRGTGVLLIEDSAQSFPRGDAGDFWRGDLVVLSFGRGKPVSLLGGGAVLFRDSRYDSLLPEYAAAGDGSERAFRLQAALYNRLLSPRLYWLPQCMPFLHLGETRYSALEQAGPIDAVRLALLAANIRAYRREQGVAHQGMARLVGAAAAAGADLLDLPSVCGLSQHHPLLRYPVLCAQRERDRIYQALGRRGLGASIMYPAILPELPGLESVFAGKHEFPAARSFASRLLTLPAYDRLGASDADSIRACLAAGDMARTPANM